MNKNCVGLDELELIVFYAMNKDTIIDISSARGNQCTQKPRDHILAKQKTSKKTPGNCPQFAIPYITLLASMLPQAALS